MFRIPDPKEEDESWRKRLSKPQSEHNMTSYILASAGHIETFVFFGLLLVIGVICMSASMAMTVHREYALGGRPRVRRWWAGEKRYMTKPSVITYALLGVQLFLLLMLALVWRLKGSDAALDYFILAAAIQGTLMSDTIESSREPGHPFDWRKHRKYFGAVGFGLASFVAFLIRNHSFWLDLFTGALMGGFILFALIARRITAFHTENPLRQTKDALAWIAIALATVPYLWVLTLFFCLWQVTTGHAR
jgi:hypothetical protein